MARAYRLPEKRARAIKSFRLSSKSVDILNTAKNASELIENLILRYGKSMLKES